MFRSAEDQGAVEIGALEQGHEQIEFLLGRDRINGVRHGFGRRTAGADLDHFGLTQNPRRQALDFRRQGGGKKQGLPVGGNLFDDPAHVREKPHVEHSIDFIEHEDAHVSEIHRTLLEQIQQPAGRRGDDVHSASGFFALLAIPDSAVHHRDAQVGETAVVAKSGFDLGGQLSRRLEHEAPEISMLRQKRQDGQSESGGLAGAGLGGADQVFAGENNRKGAKLDGRGFGEPHRLGAAHHLGRQAKIFK